MKILKDLKALIEAEEIEREEKPWYIRIPLNVFDFLWYRVILRLEDLPKKIKWNIQFLTRGYSDYHLWNLSSFIIDRVREPLKEYVRMQTEEGMALPVEFETDPAAWLVVLQKIEYAIDSEWLENHDWDSRKTKNMSDEQIVQHNKDVKEGFELFGRHLRDFWE